MRRIGLPDRQFELAVKGTQEVRPQTPSVHNALERKLEPEPLALQHLEPQQILGSQPDSTATLPSNLVYRTRT